MPLLDEYLAFSGRVGIAIRQEAHRLGGIPNAVKLDKIINLFESPHALLEHMQLGRLPLSDELENLIWLYYETKL